MHLEYAYMYRYRHDGLVAVRATANVNSIDEINQASIAKADPDSQVELMHGDFRYIETARINQSLYGRMRFARERSAKVRRTDRISRRVN